MQMVAASKMRKAQEAAVAMRPFERLLYRMQRRATLRAQTFRHPLHEVREVRKRAVVLVAADKGLCGALNTNVFRAASTFDIASTVFITAGRKAAQFVARTKRQLIGDFAYGDTPRYAEARAIAVMVRELFLKGDVDEVKIVASQFINTMTQVPVTIELLPVGKLTSIEVPGALSEEELAADTRETLFEPSARDVLGYLLPHYINLFVYFVLLNAKASEQSARMVAMKNATDSAEDLIDDLSLEYNKLRQANITKELLEIAGGQAG
jgi:F-type H+-transporting ATPase subunit gamma